MADSKKTQYKLIGYSLYKSGNGKALFVQRYGCENVTGVACDVLFLGGKNHEKVTEDAIGKEVEPRMGKNKDGEYYVYDVDIK